MGLRVLEAGSWDSGSVHDHDRKSAINCFAPVAPFTPKGRKVALANRSVGSHPGKSSSERRFCWLTLSNRALVLPCLAPQQLFVLGQISPDQMAGGAARSSTSFPKSCAEC